MSIRLSVIMPVHGGARHLGATLASAAAEAPGPEVEFRLYNSLDDGGAARAVADGFAGRLNIVWCDRFDLVPWTAKTNLGVAEARGAWVAMLHQDDLWLPGHLAALDTAMRDYPDVAFSTGPSRFVDARGAAVGDWRLPFAAGRVAARAASLSLLVQNAIAIPSPLIRRSAWAAAGGMDEALWYTADWDLYLKLLAHGDMAVRPMATTAFRLHGGSLTMQGRHQAGAMEQQHAAVLARHLPLLAPVPPAVEQRARASAALNCALAGASAGRLRALAGALLRLAALGPLGMAHYRRESRIAERVWPRLRLALAGGM